VGVGGGGGEGERERERMEEGMGREKEEDLGMVRYNNEKGGKRWFLPSHSCLTLSCHCIVCTGRVKVMTGRSTR
jgi:hypothetical protein